MIELIRSTSIACSADAAFALVADVPRFPALYERVARFERVAGEGLERGSVHRLLVRVGSTVVRSVVRVDVHEPPRRIAWTGIAGVDQAGEVRITPNARGVELEIRVRIGLPGGLVGRLAERYFARLLTPRLEAALLAARRCLEFGDPVA